MTSQVTLLMRMTAPRGMSPWNISSLMVLPTMHTALPARTSLSVNNRPSTTFQLRTSENALSVPITFTRRLSLPMITCMGRRETGAMAAKLVASRLMALRSAISNGGADWADPPMRIAPPGMMVSMFDPILEISSCTCRGVPAPSVTITITAATPMMMPSTVRLDRNTLRRISRSAMRSVLMNIRRPALCLSRVRSCRRGIQCGDGRRRRYLPRA